ncbi:methyltransferase domain-containing protein [Kitasatospora sp. NPDC094016]|uniref:class I SAM-dependent methyltransferase n=1 Tax=Kitasatospora sp. NPDC094016 TaxID=3154986 RepID=UPI003326C2AD
MVTGEVREERSGMRPVVRETYGPENLSADPAYAGGFINFGYWHDIDLEQPLTQADRIRSEENVYRQLLETVGPVQGARILEVGCGLGMGCALALREYAPTEVTGLDIHPEQLRRARETHAGLLQEEPGRLRFLQGAAEHMPVQDGAVDVLLTVEAVQHFPELEPFAAEAFRVLRPGGRVAVATFLAADDAPERPAQLAKLLENYEDGLDHARPAKALTDALTAAGLTGARAHSIGSRVWPGFDLWVSKAWAPDSWPRNFLRAYKEGILDYYVITACRPGR